MELSSAGGQVVSQNQVIASDGGNQSAQPSPDGRRIVFQSGRTGRPEIWRSDADGSALLQMTSFDRGFSGTPRWSPDGRWIAFDHHHETHSQIYLIDSEGRNMHAVTLGNYENVVPAWSRDGTAVYFASNRTGSMQVWRRELANGRETQVTYHGGFAAFESYDAKTLYHSRFEGGGIWSMPVGGGEERQVTDALHKGYWGHFAVTDAGLYLLNSEKVPEAHADVLQLPDAPAYTRAPIRGSVPNGLKSRRFARRTDIVVCPAGSPAQFPLDGGELPVGVIHRSWANLEICESNSSRFQRIHQELEAVKFPRSR